MANRDHHPAINMTEIQQQQEQRRQSSFLYQSILKVMGNTVSDSIKEVDEEEEDDVNQIHRLHRSFSSASSSAESLSLGNSSNHGSHQNRDEQNQQQTEESSKSPFDDSERVLQLKERRQEIETNIKESKVWSSLGDDIDHQQVAHHRSTALSPARSSRPLHLPPRPTSSADASSSNKSYEFRKEDLQRIDNDVSQKKKTKHKQGLSNDTPETDPTTTCGSIGFGGGVGDEMAFPSIYYSSFLEEGRLNSNLKFLDHHEAQEASDVPTISSYNCFLIVLHATYGMLLLHYSKHPKKPPHYQLPGGNITTSDFEMAQRISSSIGLEEDVPWATRLYLAGRAACARLVEEQTGLKFDTSRLHPMVVRKHVDDEYLMNEYKQRLFYLVEVSDDDLELFQKSTYSAARNSIECPLHLRLSEKHTGFRFETDAKRAVAFLKYFSRGRVTKTLWGMIKTIDTQQSILVDAVQEQGRNDQKDEREYNKMAKKTSNELLVDANIANYVDESSQKSADDSDNLSLDRFSNSQEQQRKKPSKKEDEDNTSPKKNNTIDSSNRISLGSYFSNQKPVNQTQMIDDAGMPHNDNENDTRTIVNTGYDQLLLDATKNVDWKFLQEYTGPCQPDDPFEEPDMKDMENQPPPPPPQPLEEPGKIYYGGYVFVVHPKHGLLLLNRGRKHVRPEHVYQTPGGRVDEIDFEHYTYGSWVAQCYLACRAACVRELQEMTGMQVNAQRLHPVTFASSSSNGDGKNDKTNSNGIKIREDQDGEMLLMNEYEERLFYVLTVTDDDFQQVKVRFC